jgi:FtsP/CotA-like multicopper oxidase with cupredoxin domain
MQRRNFLIGTGALAALGGTYFLTRKFSSPNLDLSKRSALKSPPLLDTVEQGKLDLTAQYGRTAFFPNAASDTLGFNQDYLGPTVRIKVGELRSTIRNQLRTPVTVHWHGLLVRGEHDGGPHIPIEAGQSWAPKIEINQKPTTAFYHTHIHGRTASDVYAGLAGGIHVTDGRDGDRAIPNDYGVDDLTLMIQDRKFTDSGMLDYELSMMNVMHGFTADTMLVNGQVNAFASVPKGIVRLRLINGSNARIYTLYASDNRPLHLIATDGGFLNKPKDIHSVRLSPGERVEILVDFGDENPMTLMSSGDPNSGPSGMMGRASQLIDQVIDRSFVVLPFVVDDRIPARITTLVDQINGDEPDLSGREVEVREFTLNMNVGSNGMMGGMMGGMGINGRGFDMSRIDFNVGLGTIEKWIVSTDMLAHPFHIHGVSFQVLKENNGQPKPESAGWKDTVVVDGTSELLVKFGMPASEDNPFMYHCHILEHEDNGMMGQFTVS